MKLRAYIAILVAMMANAVLFGVGIIAVTAVPYLSENASTLIPAVVIASFVIAPVIGWYIAPMLRSRWQRMQAPELWPDREASR